MNPLPEAASIARLRSSSGGSFVASGPLTPRLGIQVAGTLNEYTRLERERVDTLPSHTQSLSAHLAYKAEQGDDVRLFAQSDRLSFPSIGRAMLVDPALQQREQLDAARHHLESRHPRRARLVGAT